jgi:phosphinothricin acetyltransferase
MTIIITDMAISDWPAVTSIYQEGIDTGNATFEPHPPVSWEEWCEGKINSCSLVAREGGDVLGWAASSRVSSRCVYEGVAEVSIYIKQSERGKGIGSLLLQELIKRSEANGIWTLQAGIFPENQASIRLHLGHGFRLVGLREKLGKMKFGSHAGQWRDVMLLERRSPMLK